MFKKLHYKIRFLSTPAPAILAMFLFMSACRGNGSDSGAADSASLFDTAMSDSLRPEEEKDSEKKSLNLHTTEEILNYIENSPNKSRYEKGIIPQMARDVPLYASKLLDNEYPGFLIVDKNTMKLYRYDKYGVEVERVGIACSHAYGTKHALRDNRTPEGFFTIEGIYDSTEWLYTDDDGNTSEVKGQFGPRFMRLRVPNTSQIGIHGTVAPWSIGGRRSHGCIRMLNENIMRFAKICEPGWPVIVSPGPKDMRVNESEGYHIPSVAVIPGKRRCLATDTPAFYQSDSKSATDNVSKTTTDSVTIAPESVGNPESTENSEHKAEPMAIPDSVAAN